MGDFLNVLFVHRKGIFRCNGGEQDQLRNTAAYLAEIGVQATLTESIPDDLHKYDLVHFFTIDESQIPEIEAAKGMPRVMTPVFWDRAQALPMDSEMEEWPRPGRECLDKISYCLRRLLGSRDHRVFRVSRALFYQAIRGYGRFQSVVDEIDLFLPNSEAEARALQTFYVFDKCSYRVVPNAVNSKALDNISDYAEQNLPVGLPFVCCSGGIDKRKNQYSLLKALLDVEVPIVIAGGCRDRTYLEAVNRIAERRKGVYFTGHLAPSDLHSIYAAAKVHALPSYHDTPGIANLEAVAHECVNVGTQIGGLREYLHEHSLYCNPFSIDHIREQIVKALDMPPNKAGAQLVRANYTYDHVAKLTKEAYLSVLEAAK